MKKQCQLTFIFLLALVCFKPNHVNPLPYLFPLAPQGVNQPVKVIACVTCHLAVCFLILIVSENNPNVIVSNEDGSDSDSSSGPSVTESERPSLQRRISTEDPHLEALIIQTQSQTPHLSKAGNDFRPTMMAKILKSPRFKCYFGCDTEGK
nr:uncharacterized protein LOC113395269 [Vanessa tameamea]